MPHPALPKVFALSMTFWQGACCSSLARFCIFSYRWQVQVLGWISKENSRKSATILVKNTPQRGCKEQHSHVLGTRIRTTRCWYQGTTMVCRSLCLGAVMHYTEGDKRWRANTLKTWSQSRASCFGQHLSERLKENLIAHGDELKRWARAFSKPPSPLCELGKSPLAWQCPSAQLLAWRCPLVWGPC